jgi:dienelactone hydrolase
MFLRILIGTLVASGAVLVATEPTSATDQGPRLWDDDLFDSLDSGFPALSQVTTLQKRGDILGALSALAAFVRAREEPADFGQKAKRDKNADTSRAESILSHRFVVVGIPHTFGEDIDWGFNPTTAPGSRLDRDNEWTWQLNRHGAWVTLARAYQATGDERFAKEFDSQFSDWVAECPVPINGANQRPYSKWRTIEAGIRMSWTWPSVFTIFRRSPSVKDSTLICMLKSMIEHGRYLRSYQTGGNWATMEMNGLFHVGVLLPFVKESKDWRDFAAKRLLTELDTQVYPDGAQIELTPGYHNVALRSFLGPVEIAASYGYRLPDDYLTKLERMFAYNMWVMRPDRDAPRWNDSWHVDVPGMLKKGFVLFDHRKDFQWITTNGQEGTPPDHTSRFFPYAGQVVMRSGWESDALFLGFEAGPFGYGHQHEDKLGIVIFAYGKELLVEGGSYAYDASKWRRYVLSSYAHNVALVDGQGQVQRGLPRQQYVSREPIDVAFHSDAQYDYARGTYDLGFGHRDQRPARHSREVVFLKKPGIFFIRDTLEPLDGKSHSYQALFHLDAQNVNVDRDNGVVETQDVGSANIRIVPLRGGDLKTSVVRGQETPVVQGWLPRGHGIRGVRPIPTIVYERRSAKPVRFLTVLQPLRDSNQKRVSTITEQGEKILVSFADGESIDLSPMLQCPAEQIPKEVKSSFAPPSELADDFGTYKSLLTFQDGTPVKTAADWQRRRKEILATWRSMTGSWPALIEKPKVQYSEQNRRASFIQHNISVEIAPEDQTVEGYLLVPDGDGPFPAVLVVYYDAETGAGLGKELRDFGYQLAICGFVALSIGTPEFCSLKPPYKPLCKQSEEEPPLQPLSALAYVAANCHNALANMPNVNSERIGIIGHSYGGKWALFASCLYEQFACAVWSDPGIVFDESRANINYWEPWYLGYEPGLQRQRGIPSSANPRTGAYKELVRKGHDLHELHALMAPRAFLVSGGAEDPPKRWKALNHTLAVNKLLGYNNRVAMTNRKSHSPTPESNEQIYAFLEHFLKSDR